MSKRDPMPNLAKSEEKRAVIFGILFFIGLCGGIVAVLFAAIKFALIYKPWTGLGN